MSNFTFAVWVSVTAAIGYLVSSAVYSLFFSPLSKYPGPFLSKISNLPSFYHATRGDRHLWLWRNLQIYGDKFRTGPDSLCFCSPQANRAIYGVRSNVKKAIFYEGWKRNKDDGHTLNTTDITLHAQKRYALSQAFTQSSVRSAAPFIIKHVNRWISLLNENDGKGSGESDWSEPRDVAEWNDRLAFDIMGDLCFGRSCEIKEPGENPFKAIPKSIAEYMRFFYPLTKSPLMNLFVALKPWGLDYTLDKLTPPDARKFYDFVGESVSQREAEFRESKGSSNAQPKAREDIFHYLLNAKRPDSDELAYDKPALLAEAILLVIAGSDTSSHVLSGLMFYLTHYPRVYNKLAKEIRDAFQSMEDIDFGQKLNSCEYLSACIEETLRISPPGTSEHIRTVLPGGIQIDGELIPEGTHVGTSVFANGRSETVYGDPNVFRPERWIVSEETGVTSDDVARAKSIHIPFLSGAGVCIGKHVALLELKLTLARLLYRCDMRMAPGNTLSEGNPSLDWGRRFPNQYQFRDVYIAQREGPMIQFKQRS